MNINAPLNARTLHRNNCFYHVLKRARARQIALSMREAESLQDALRRLEPVFVSDRSRYRIPVRHHGVWLIAIYDARLHVLVTIWRDEKRVR
ncbi:hypothetical protein [Thalassospira sp. MCCC 1A01428]|uniref:hypothetical protein n=1 Tax=Thalassospira sp. MCCC 1A01428 TaxID=1470575 RepID=UPI000A1F0E50|nr:hypothetical protein [Thalassospira sp. MCCC 1A01428]OSQ45557.1 hypothetical protein THS27_04295 [Thalassospira sp. MCCC 1A01428]